MLLGVRSARASEINWRCPWLRLEPMVREYRWVSDCASMMGRMFHQRIPQGAPTSFMNDSLKLAGHCRDVVFQPSMS